MGGTLHFGVHTQNFRDREMPGRMQCKLFSFFAELPCLGAILCRKAEGIAKQAEAVRAASQGL